MQGSVEKNPLILIYRSLNKSESRRLGKWLDSPAHNQRDDVKALHAYLTGGEDRLEKASALGKERIYRRLFPGTTYDDARLRQTFHWALKATEGFLAYEQWSSKEIDAQLSLIAALRQRNLSSPLQRSLKKAERMQETTQIRNEDFYRSQYRLELELDEYRVYHKLNEDPNFQQIANNLDVAYLIEKLKVGCNMLYQTRVFRTQFDLRFLDEVVSYVEQYDLDQYPALAIYYYVYRGLTGQAEEEGSISRLRSLILEHGGLLKSNGRRYVFLMAINICISHMNRGREPYTREAFEFYRLGFAEGIISEDGKLTRETYLNVVSIALKLKEFDWAEHFIREQASALEADIRENTQRFAQARLGYEQKDFDTTMRLLVQVDFRHPVYNLLAKTMLLKIYYELDEFDALDSLLDSMTTYIRRKKLSDLHRDHFGNAVRLVRQLSRINTRDEKKIMALRTRIETTSPLAEKKWMLEQLALQTA
ncbi:hypothetical protein [Lewinella sp. W8]|uniref:hypothetical protein n=1 Tax=Lewinella sp. W8 TaxID=2528208 RepID=UPI001068B727|nr:hypothetical protein [Lewinella sp. W8]MTB51626.1 hypothetical protein [Lewinella sp. W8]